MLYLYQQRRLAYNNWGAQRERSSSGRYRMVMWDSEAGWSRFGKAINYNTIDNLILNNNTECSNCFKYLYPNAEFKLLVADRIQRAFFNGGVLDDRNTTTSTVSKHVNFFKAQVDPVLRFVTNNAGESVDLGLVHLTTSIRRRAAVHICLVRPPPQARLRVVAYGRRHRRRTTALSEEL